MFPNYQEIEYFLNAGIDVNTVVEENYGSNTGLGWAISADEPEVIRLYLARIFHQNQISDSKTALEC